MKICPRISIQSRRGPANRLKMFRGHFWKKEKVQRTVLSHLRSSLIGNYTFWDKGALVYQIKPYARQIDIPIKLLEKKIFVPASSQVQKKCIHVGLFIALAESSHRHSIFSVCIHVCLYPLSSLLTTFRPSKYTRCNMKTNPKFPSAYFVCPLQQ